MAPPVSARKRADNFIASSGPDVCWTPMGCIMVPVAYNTIALFDTCEDESRNVFDNGCADFHFNTVAMVVQGHEPGTGGGVVVQGYRTYAAATESTSSVATNGYLLVRDGDPAMLTRHDPALKEFQSSMTPKIIESYLTYDI